MRNILFLGLCLFTLASCSNFLEDYSQDESRVESITDLDELLRGGGYYAAGCAASGKNSIGTPFFGCLNFMTDELKQNEESSDCASYTLLNSFENMFGYYTWQRYVGMDYKGTRIGDEDTDWKMAYKYINITNMILDELENVSIQSLKEENDKIRVEGETRFLRALYYFTLVNVYAEPYVPAKAASTAGVPLKLTAYIEDRDFTSATLEDVYAQILEDLQRAEECLVQCERKSLYRADYTSVLLLKSRVYLYMQDYAKAKEYAQKVVDRNIPLTDLHGYAEGTANIYTELSEEVLFSMGGHFLSNYIYGNDTRNREIRYSFFISDDLEEAYDDNDLRKGRYIVKGTYGYLYKKIFFDYATQTAPQKVSDNFLFRVSEAYLNLAEAAALDGDEPAARTALTTLMGKRYATVPVVDESGNALIDLIRAERQRELCLEGHRWFDLRRYTVCGKYPWSKEIIHTYCDYELDGYYYEKTRTRTFKLEKNDKAYTLAFPKKVLEFQNTLGSNGRPDRLPISENN